MGSSTNAVYSPKHGRSFTTLMQYTYVHEIYKFPEDILAMAVSYTPASLKECTENACRLKEHHNGLCILHDYIEKNK